MSSHDPRDQLARLIFDLAVPQPPCPDCVGKPPNGTGGARAAAAAIEHKLGWRPPPRVIETWAESADLPSRAIVVDAGGSVWQHIGEGWYRAGKSRSDAPEGMPHPITVLWEPEEVDRG